MHDLVVENALIVDGTGGPSFHGGVAVTGGRITAVGTRRGEAARETLFDFPVLNQDPEGVRPLVTDDRFLIGLSDGGAHVDQLCDAGYATHLLGKWVREQQALTLEAAVRRLASEVAELFGIPDRGVLAPGKTADLVVFDPAGVDDETPEYVHDLPGGGKRLVARARGVHVTVVGGRVLYREGAHTGAWPGAVLPSAPA